jgi:hypothetical protein
MSNTQPKLTVINGHPTTTSFAIAEYFGFTPFVFSKQSEILDKSLHPKRSDIFNFLFAFPPKLKQK